MRAFITERRKQKKTTSDPTLKTTGRKGNKMTKQQKGRYLGVRRRQLPFENLFYLTQYAAHMTDEGFYNKIANRAARYDLDLELFIEIDGLMPMIPDAINQKLFVDILNVESDADLEKIIKILTAIDNEDLNELDRLMDGRLERMMNEEEIHDEDYFTELAEYDLRENGMDASCLSWANDIPSNFEFAELDIYDQFTTMTTAEVIDKFFDEYY